MSNSLKWVTDLITRGDIVSWLIVLALTLLATLLLKVLMRLTAGRLTQLSERTKASFDNLWAALLSSTKPWFLFVLLFFFIGAPALDPTAQIDRALKALLVLTASLQVILWGTKVIRHWRTAHLEKRVAKDASSKTAIGFIAAAVQVLFVVIVTLVALSNLGVDIAALIAGLGIGGIAVALAAQNILGDLFASVSIILDKPFVVGNFVIVGDMSGTVEYIGLRTTRVRSLSGEQMIFANKDLLESRIRNYKSMWQRRVVLNFRITYSTPAEKVEQVPRWVKQFVEEDPALRFDRCHFAGYGEFALLYETVFFVKDSSYNVFMDQQEKLLLKMFRKFKEEEVEFALPARSIQVESLPERAANLSSPMAT